MSATVAPLWARLRAIVIPAAPAPTIAIVALIVVPVGNDLASKIMINATFALHSARDIQTCPRAARFPHSLKLAVSGKGSSGHGKALACGLRATPRQAPRGGIMHDF